MLTNNNSSTLLGTDKSATVHFGKYANGLAIFVFYLLTYFISFYHWKSI